MKIQCCFSSTFGVILLPVTTNENSIPDYHPYNPSRVYRCVYIFGDIFTILGKFALKKKMKIVPMISIAGYYTSTYVGKERENGITPPLQLNAWQRTRVSPNR